jgi:hypothetical protein
MGGVRTSEGVDVWPSRAKSIAAEAATADVPDNRPLSDSCAGCSWSWNSSDGSPDVSLGGQPAATGELIVEDPFWWHPSARLARDGIAHLRVWTTVTTALGYLAVVTQTGLAASVTSSVATSGLR